MRATMLTLGLVLGFALAGPARAIEPYPGETREAFVARAALEQQRKLAAADAAAQATTPGLAVSGGSSGRTGGGFGFGTFAAAVLMFGARRMLRGVFRASRTLTQGNGQIRGVDTFEDRLAERLRELDRAAPPPIVPAAVAAAPVPSAATVAMPGPRTFGRRAS